MTVPPRLKVMDMAIGLTGQTPTSLNQNDPTVRVAMALVKLFQSVGLEREIMLLVICSQPNLPMRRKIL